MAASKPKVSPVGCVDFSHSFNSYVFSEDAPYLPTTKRSVPRARNCCFSILAKRVAFKGRSFICHRLGSDGS